MPLLAEAMSQTGTPSVLVVAPTQDQLNALVEGLEGRGLRRRRRDQRRAGDRRVAQLPPST